MSINKSSPVQVQGLTNSFAQTPTKVSSSWSQLSVGDGYNIGIKTDGTLWGWGRNDYGQLGINNGTILKASSPIQIGTSSWSKISSGLYSSLGIRSDGLMFEWGYNYNNQMISTNKTSYWLKVVTGLWHSIAIKSDGSLWAWGYNGYGQIGNNTASDVSSPVLIDSGSWINIAAGYHSSFGVKNDGSLWAWGYNTYGELGDGTSLPKSSPTQIGTSSWTFIAATGYTNGTSSALGIKLGGLLYTWGYNSYGQLGDGTTINKSSPVQVAGIANNISFAMATVGQYFSLALDTNGKLWSWGDNAYYNLGDGTNIARSSPVQVSAPAVFSSVSAGTYYTLALSTNKSLYVWGLNNYGQLGNSSTATVSYPTSIPGNSWISVAATTISAAGVDTLGRLYTWGNNNTGQLGQNNGANYSSPVLVGTSSWTAVGGTVSGGRPILMFQSSSGQWFGAGNYVGGVYGGDTTIDPNQSSPVQIGVMPIVQSPTQIGTSSWTQVSAGYSHNVAIRSDNTLWGWGRNNFGQLGSITTPISYSSPIQITSTSDYTNISAGLDYTIAIKSDSTIYAWGKNTLGQLGISTPTQTTYSWLSLGGGGYSLYAIRNDYKLFAWGYNANGSLGTGDTITRSSPVQIGNDSWTSVTGGSYQAFGIKPDSTLWAWGNNSVGQLGINDTLSRSSPVQIAGSWSQVYSGYSTTIGIKTDGTLWGWGYGGGTNNNILLDGYNYSSPVQLSTRSWTQVGIGFSHIIGLDTTGTAWVWGSNSYGQLGTGDILNRNFQYQLSTTKSWTSVFATQFESYAIDTNGILYGWGLNQQQGYQWNLGDGTSITRSSPVQIGTKKWKKVYNTPGYGFITSSNDNPSTIFIDENDYAYAIGYTLGTGGDVWGKYGGLGTMQYSFTQLSSGDNQTAIIRSDGRIFSFGINTAGQLGDITIVSRSSPIQVGATATVTEGEIWRNIQTPRSASVAIRGDYKLYAWGSNNWNILGTNDLTTVVRSSPVQISSLTKSWVQLSARYSHAVGITSDGMLYGWGTNTYNAVGFITSWAQVSTSSSNALLLRSDGTLYATGGNTTGAIGDNTTVNKSSPVQISSDKFIKISAGVSNTNFAISDTYKLFAWGTNANGQLGDGTTVNKSSPTQIGTSSWLSLTATPYTTFAIRGDNTLWAWGLNEFGIMNPTVADSYSSPVQIGTSSWTSVSANRDLTTGNPHVLGIDINNKLYAWGYNFNGELGLGYTTQTNSWTNGFISLNSVLVKSDGTLWTWGQDTLMYGGTVASSSSYRSSPVQVSSITKSISQVASSFSGIFVIASDSTMYAWGNNTNGYLGIPVSWKSLTAGTGYSLGIRNDNTLWAWGLNTYGQIGQNDTIYRSSPVQIGSYSNWTTVNTSELIQSVIAINDLGQLFTWGENAYGQLGNLNANGHRSSPIQIGTSYSWVQAVIGRHALATTTNGLLFGWGWNPAGEVGDNTTISRSSPIQISSNSFTQLAIGRIGNGNGFSLAITGDNKLFAWGNNDQGQLGDSTTITRSSPVQVAGSWSSVAAATSFAFGIKTNYSLYTWGGPGAVRGVPTALAYASATMAIAPSGNRIFSINKDGVLYGVGYATDNMLGVAIPPNLLSNPVQINAGGRSFTFVNSREQSAAVAIDTTGKLFWWGNGAQGTRGDNTTLDANSPYQVGTDNWIYATVDMKNVYGVKSDYTLWGWGGNDYGQLGQNDTINRSSPVQIAGSWTQVETSQSTGNWTGTTGAIKTDGTLWTLGYNLNGQLGDNSTIHKSSPVQIPGSWTKIAVGWAGMLAIKSNGTLWAWGNNANGTLGDTSTINKSSPVQIGTSSWSQVDTNSYMTYAITVDGKLFAWGNNSSGQLGLNDTLNRSSPVQIGSSSWSFVKAAGGSASTNGVAIDISNRVFVWGLNSNGQLGQYDTANRSSPVQFGNILTTASSPVILSAGSWSKISATTSAAAAIDTTGKLFVWGINGQGELGLGDTIARYYPTSADSVTYSNVFVGGSRIVRVRSDNVATASGLNSWVLGDASSVSRSSPVQVTGTRYLLPQQITGSWNSISVTSSNGIAVKSDGTLWTWGDNLSGQLGTNEQGSLAYKVSFTQIGSDTNWSKGVMAASQAIATKTNGTLYAWGANNTGTLGDSTVVNKSSPIQVAGSYTVVDMGVAGTVGAIKTDGTLWTWGYNSYGTMGDGTGANKSSPVQVAGSWTNIRITGQWSTYGIQTSGSLWAWGNNGSGQLGLNDAISRSSPVQVGTETGWSFTNAKTIIDYAAFSLLRNNALYAIGNGAGTGIFIYDNSTISRSSPVQVWATTSFLPITQVGNSSWSQISAGAGHSVALDPNNKLYTWGQNTAGQLATTGSFVQVNATGGVIRSDGIMYVWGKNEFGMLGDNTTIDKISMAAASFTSPTNYWQQSANGDRHIIYLASDGSLWGCGLSSLNSYGDSTDRSSPVQVAAGNSFVAISAGAAYSLAVRDDGQLWGVGNNSYGQLGTGNTSSPKTSWGQLTTGSWTQVFSGAGSYNSFALKSDGTLYATGQNTYGNLGLGDTVTRSNWTQVPGSWTFVYAMGTASIGGEGTTYGIKSDGTLWGWGGNGSGQLGQNDTIDRSSPVQITAGSGSWAMVTTTYFGAGANFGHLMAWKTDGSVYTCGYGGIGVLGQGDTISRSSPVQIPGTWKVYTKPQNVYAGTPTFVLVDTSNNVYYLGFQPGVALANLISSSRSSPTQIGSASAFTVATTMPLTANTSSPSLVSSSSFTQIAAGSSVSAAIDSVGRLFTWGQNNIGQLGQNDTINRSSPVQVGTSSYVAVSVQNSVTTAVDSTYRLFAWGQNTVGQVGDNTIVNRSSPVQIATTTSTTVYLPNIISTSSFSQVSAGQDFTIAIKKDGTLWGWGSNYYGQAVPQSRPIVQGNTGSTVKFIQLNGFWYSQGSGGYGQLGDNSTVNRSTFSLIPGSNDISSLLSSDYCAYALKNNGTWWAWGRNVYGEVGQNLIASYSSPVQIGSSTNWSKIGFGTYNGAAINTSAQLYMTGYNAQGQIGDGTTISRSSPVQVAGSWSMVSTGDSHTLAIKSDGTLWSWGSNNQGQLGAVTTWADIAAGGSHILGVRSDGTLWAWGLNNIGQVGDGTTISRSSPVQIGTGSWTKVSAGPSHSVALRSDNTIWSWGQNNTCQLGDNSTLNRSSPVQVSVPAGSYVSIFSSQGNSGAIKSDSRLYIWGAGNAGQIGDYSFLNRSNPVQVAGSWSQIATAQSRFMGIKTDSSLWTWGVNTYGQLGDGTTTTKSSPIQIGTSSWSQISAGADFSLGLTIDNDLFAWGINTNGQLGIGSVAHRSSPVQITTGIKYNYILASTITSFAKEYSTNLLYGWGYNGWGAIGDITIVDKSTPSIVTGAIAINFSKISATGDMQAQIITGLAPDNTLYYWGNSTAFGTVNTTRSSPTQIGLSNSTSSPVQVGTNNNWKKVVAGQTHSVALDTNNNLYVWGGNSVGQLGLGNTLNRSYPVYITNEYVDVDGTGGQNTMALRKDGTLWGTGTNGGGQLGDGTIVSKSSPVQVTAAPKYFKNINSGGFTTFALGVDNALWMWGNSPEGNSAPVTQRSSPFQIGTGILTTSISSPVQIASGSWTNISAGASHAFAIKSDSTLWGWGSNYLGRLGLVQASSSNSNIMPTQGIAGNYYSAMILNDGSLWITGTNTYGNIGDNTVAAKSSPVQVPGSWINVGLGTEYLSTFAVRSDKTLWAWGRNDLGRLGDFTTTSRSNPVQIMPTISWSCVAAANTSTYAITIDGRLFTWGASTGVDLGRSYGFASVPTQIMSGRSFAQIAAGYSNGYALATDGTLWAWGNNSSGPLGDGTTINRSSPVQIAGSWSFITAWSYGGYGANALGIKTDGTIWSWGDNSYGKLGQNDTLNRSSPVQLAAGNSWISGGVTNYNTYMIDSNYNLYVIGYSSYANGEIGYNRSSPVQIGSTLNGVATNWHKVFSNGQSTSYFVNRNGSLYVMGNNASANLGTGNVTDTAVFTKPLIGLYRLNDYNNSAFSSPVQISTLATSWSQISAGSSHSAGVSTSFEMFTWGAGNTGQIGDGLTFNRDAPTKIGTSSWNNVTAGIYNTVGSLFIGSVFVWGSNTYGQFGDNTIVSKSSPVQVPTGNMNYVYDPMLPDPMIGIQVKDMTTSNQVNRLIIRKDNNLLYSYGEGSYGLLGRNFVGARYSSVTGISNEIQVSVNSPTQIPGSYNLVSAGKQHVLATKSDGTLYTWGSYQNSTTLKQPYKFIAGGYSDGTYAAIRGDDTLWMWGYNAAGVLGQNDTIYRSSPVQVAGSWASIAVNSSHILAIKTDGSLWAWGENTYGQLGNTTTIFTSSPVQIGTSSWSMVVSTYYYHSLGIDINGRLFAWGYNPYGQLGTGNTINYSSPTQVGTSSWITVSTNPYSTVGITIDNNLFAWGYNNNGQLGQNNTTNYSSPVQVGTAKYKNVAISLGTNTTVIALKNDGTLWGWGWNEGYRSLGDGTTITRSSPVQLATTKTFKDISKYFIFTTFAIAVDNTVYTWGFSVYNYFTGITYSTPTLITIPGSFGNDRVPLTAKMIGQNGINATFIGMDNEAYGVGSDTGGALTYYGALPTLTYPTVIGLYGTSSPVQLNSGTWDSVSAGNETSTGISNGALYFWGRNNNYQAGTITNNTQISSPTVILASRAVSTDAGTSNTGGISNA